MRSQNHQAINKAYRKFSGYLFTIVLIGVSAYFFYMRTTVTEVERIVDKTEEYDKIYVRQVELAGRIDTLYRYMMLFNSGKNDILLQNSVSRRKQEILSSMDDMSSSDVRLYQKLMSQVNTFLSIKDSIRTARIEEELVRSDLMKCVEDNKQATRKVTLGGITLKK